MVHVIIHIFHMLFQAVGATDNTEQEALQKRLALRRSVAHRDIPDEPHLQAILGERIDELHRMLIQHDPAELKTWRTFNRKHPRHVEEVSKGYRQLALTLGYRLLSEVPYETFKETFRTELQLWFGVRPFLAVLREEPEDIMPTLFRWRQSWAYR